MVFSFLASTAIVGLPDQQQLSLIPSCRPPTYRRTHQGFNRVDLMRAEGRGSCRQYGSAALAAAAHRSQQMHRQRAASRCIGSLIV